MVAVDIGDPRQRIGRQRGKHRRLETDQPGIVVARCDVEHGQGRGDGARGFALVHRAVRVEPGQVDRSRGVHIIGSFRAFVILEYAAFSTFAFSDHTLRQCHGAADVLGINRRIDAAARSDRDHTVERVAAGVMQCEHAALAVARDKQFFCTLGAHAVERRSHFLFSGRDIDVIFASA